MMHLLYLLGMCMFYAIPEANSADFALVGELNVLSIGSHISMAPMNTLDFRSLELGSMGDPHGVEFDPVESKIYWTDRKKGTITRSRLNGGNKQVLFSNAQGPHGIALDKEDRVMYWTEEGRRSIWRSNLDGSNRTRIISTGLKEPGDMQLDPVEKRLYWIDENGIHSKIESAKVDGSDRKTLLVNSLHRNWLKHPTGISLDILERKIYWCDDKLDFIGRAEMNGSNPLNLFDKSRWWIPDLLYQPESLAVYGKYVYFVELMGFQVQRMPKDGSLKPRKVGEVDKALFVPYGPLQGPVDLFIHSDYNYCGKSPCKKGGECKGAPGWFRCNCVPGTGGPFCEQDVPLGRGPMEPTNQEASGSVGASVGGIVAGLLILVLIIAIIAFVCYRRRRGDAREEGDTIPIVFASGNQSDPPIPLKTTPSKAKEAEAAGYDAGYDGYEMATPTGTEAEKSQDLGACGSDADMGGKPPSYYEAMKQSKKQKQADGYEPLIV